MCSSKKQQQQEEDDAAIQNVTDRLNAQVSQSVVFRVRACT